MTSRSRLKLNRATPIYESRSPKGPDHTHALTTSIATMKLLTLNFLTCAIKTCKTQASSFPLHPKDSELEIVEADMNLPFLKNILPRLMWEELRVISKEVRLPHQPIPNNSLPQPLVLTPTSSVSPTSPQPHPHRTISSKAASRKLQRVNNQSTSSRARRRRIYIGCCWKRAYKRASWCAGAAGMSTRSRRGLRIFCCRGIWSE